MKFQKQEKAFSCGASALRNCILQLSGDAKPESYYRKICKTNEMGTETRNLVSAAKSLGYSCISIQTKSKQLFQQKLKNCLKSNGTAIVSIDNNQHWVAVLKYKNKLLTVVDSDFSKIKTEISFEVFSKSAFNFDKIINKYYFLLINLQNTEDVIE